ncbi:MAG TPA: hypothetical protein VGQ31_11940 [Candidatus Limnocylindrales bacterium]|nr:hypothetical protein [Candidatus Limnocylindrales bacterium]
MEDDMIDQTAAGYLELARRLEAYADLRLTPSAAATTRMRTAVMNAAHRRAALIGADAMSDAAGDTLTPPAASRDRTVRARVSWRRPAAAVLAATFALSILAGSVYGTRAGGPFYAARLWAEMANLPSGLLDRALAEGTRLDQRIREAQEASSAGDVPGTEAALAAYSSIVIEAAAGSDGDATASAALEVTVSRHVGVLTLMVGSVPTQARSAAEEALASSTTALDDLESAGKHPSDRDPSTTPGIHGTPGDSDDVVAHDPWATDPVAANHGDAAAPTAKPTPDDHKPDKGAPDPHRPPSPAPPKDGLHINAEEHGDAGAQGPAAGQARP